MKWCEILSISKNLQNFCQRGNLFFSFQKQRIVLSYKWVLSIKGQTSNCGTSICRFLDESGKFHPDEKLIPFGIGKRSCPGKALADTEVFLFLATFIQRFQFSFPKGTKVPETIEPEVGFILVCPPYDIVIEER